MIIVRLTALMRNRFFEIFNEPDETKRQALMQEWSWLFHSMVASLLAKNDYQLNLGEEYGTGRVSWNGIREKTVCFSGTTAVFQTHRLRCRKLHFCQEVIPDVMIPYLQTTVDEAVEICLDASRGCEELLGHLSQESEEDTAAEVWTIAQLYRDKWRARIADFKLVPMRSTTDCGLFICKCVEGTGNQFLNPKRRCKDLYLAA